MLWSTLGHLSDSWRADWLRSVVSYLSPPTFPQRFLCVKLLLVTMRSTWRWKGFIHSLILFNDNAVVNSWRLFLILKCFVCYLDKNCNHCLDLDICIFNDKQFKAFQYQRQMLWYVLLFWNWLYGPEIKWLLGLVAQHRCHYMTRVEPVWQRVIFHQGKGFSLLSLRICIVFVMKKEARLLWNCGKKCYRYLTALSPRCRLFIS